MLLRVCLILSVVAFASSRRSSFYRRDYSHVLEFDAYYKLHWRHEHKNWSSAFITCNDEGAELFYPQKNNEWTVVQYLVRETTKGINISDIFVGIHDQYGVGEFLTVDGQATPYRVSVDHDANVSGHGLCAVMDAQTGELHAEDCEGDLRGTSKPFICKKVEDITCPTIDTGYIYIKETRKCYKKNVRLQTWSQAMETCFMEGGILMVLSSDLEAQIVARNIIGDGPYYAGFKKMISDNDFYTVKGHKLQDSGYYQLRSSAEEEHECGVIQRFDLNIPLMLSVECDTKLPFVCELSELE